VRDLRTVDLCLFNVKIPYRNFLLEGGIAVDQGKVVSISKGPYLPKADMKKDLRGMLLLPGIVDVHVHFRDPGLTWKEDFITGSKAAVAGGVTTVCDMPNTVPPTSSLKAFKEKVKVGNRKSHVDFSLHAALPNSLKEGSKIMCAGAVSFNVGEIHSELRETSTVRNFLKFGLTISAHPEDPRAFKKFEFQKGGIERFIRYRNKLAEINAVSHLLRLVKHTHLHFCHLSTRESVNLVAEKKRKGMKITCEVDPSHILLSLADLRKLGPIAKTYPPLRSVVDRSAVLKALQDGTIDIVASDHAPHSLKEKGENIWEAPAGIAGVETSLPLMFTLVEKRELSLFRLVDAMCTLPAKIFDIRNEIGMLKGAIDLGADADFVVLDHKKKWKIRGEELHGKTKFTPFEGYEVTGKPFLTIVRGEIVFEDGEIIGKPGHGRFVPHNHKSEVLSTSDITAMEHYE
jgi:dihydroorotase (multifunctional complex type)